jgi:hypothetical protein
MLQCYTAQRGNPWTLVRELLFEQVRASAFPQLPSRWESSFVCESLNALTTFQTESNRWTDIRYEVELIDANAATHRACLRYINIPATDTPSAIRQRAERYWRGEGIQQPEIVTLSRLRIIDRAP